MKKLALIRGEDRKENIKKVLLLIKDELEPIKRAKTILLKPNLTGLFNTNGNVKKEVVETLLEFLQEFCPNFSKKKVYLFEGVGEAYYFNSQTKNIFKKLGYFDLLKTYSNLILRPIEEEVSYCEEEIQTVNNPMKIKIVKILKEADYSISLSLPKTHDNVIYTGGVKNFLMAGIRQEDKHLMHGHDNRHLYKNSIKKSLPSPLIYLLAKLRKKTGVDTKKSEKYFHQACQILNRNLATLGKKILPNLVVLDGWEFMEGEGPVQGDLIPYHLAIASTDGLKADALAVRLMGLQPKDIGYLYYLEKEGRGSLGLEGLVGEKNWDPLVKKIKMHPRYSIQKKWKTDFL